MKVPFIHSFTPLASAERNDSLPFSGASSIPLCHVLFFATLLHQLFFHPLSLHLAICFLVSLSILLFPNLYIILFWESYFLPFTVRVQTNVITWPHARQILFSCWKWKPLSEEDGFVYIHEAARKSVLCTNVNIWISKIMGDVTSTSYADWKTDCHLSHCDLFISMNDGISI